MATLPRYQHSFVLSLYHMLLFGNIEEQINLRNEHTKVMAEALASCNVRNHANVKREIAIYLVWCCSRDYDYWVTEFTLLKFLDWPFIMSAVTGVLFNYQYQISPESDAVNPQKSSAVKHICGMCSGSDCSEIF
jgi:hypothetical protein